MENALADITRMNISFDLNNIEECPPYRVTCYGKDYRSDRAHMVSCGCCGDDRLGNDMSSSEYIHDLDYSKSVNLWVLWYKFPISRILFQWTESNDRMFHYFFMEFLRDVWKEFYVPSKGNSSLFLVRM